MHRQQRSLLLSTPPSLLLLYPVSHVCGYARPVQNDEAPQAASTASMNVCVQLCLMSPRGPP